MDYRAGKPVSGTGDQDSDRKAEEIRGDIDRTRGQMSRTVEEIEQRLSPAHLKEQVDGLKERVLESYHEAKDHVKEDLTNEVRDQVQHARSAVHDATVGRVQHMVHDARHMVHDARDTVSDAGSTVLDAIKANPVPAALVALGLGWLVMSARSQGGGRRQDYRIRARSYGNEDFGFNGVYGRDEGFVYGGRDEEYADMRGGRLEGPRRAIRRGQRAVGSAVRSAEETVSNVGHRVQEGAEQVASRAGAAAHDVGERASELAHRAGDRIEHMADDARMAGRRAAYGAQRQFYRAERTVENTLHENPLALGAIALAIGTAVGLALPRTERENHLMGGAKDKLVDKTKDLAQHALEQVEEKVGQFTGGGEQQGTSRGAQASKNGLANGGHRV